MTVGADLTISPTLRPGGNYFLDVTYADVYGDDQGRVAAALPVQRIHVKAEFKSRLPGPASHVAIPLLLDTGAPISLICESWLAPRGGNYRENSPYDLKYCGGTKAGAGVIPCKERDLVLVQTRLSGGPIEFTGIPFCVIEDAEWEQTRLCVKAGGPVGLLGLLGLFYAREMFSMNVQVGRGGGQGGQKTPAYVASPSGDHFAPFNKLTVQAPPYLYPAEVSFQGQRYKVVR